MFWARWNSGRKTFPIVFLILLLQSANRYGVLGSLLLSTVSNDGPVGEVLLCSAENAETSKVLLELVSLAL